MDTIAPIRPAIQRPLRISLTAGPAAAAEARTYVREVISAWEVPVDPEIATLLTSELVTNAIRFEKGDTIKLFIACSCGHLRVYVHDTSRAAPVPLDAPADAETGRGLMLVDSLSTDWGHYRTPAGKAVYFTLRFETNPDDACDVSPRPNRNGDGPS